MNRRVVLYAIGLVIIGAIWYFAIASPLWSRQREAIRDTRTVTSELSAMEQRVATLPKWLATRDSLRTVRTELSERLFAREQLDELIMSMRSMATDNDLEWITVSLPLDELVATDREATSPTHPQSLGLVVTVAGGFYATGTFIERLEEKAYFGGVRNATMSVDRDRAGRIVSQIAIELLISPTEVTS